MKDPSRTPEEKITRLVEIYQLPLLRLCFAYLHDRHLAEDAVQETFLKAYRGMDAFRGEASEKTWLSRIAVNQCRDLKKSGWFRHTDRRVTLDMLPQPADRPSEKDDALTLAVMALPVRLRETVLLYYFQDMTTVEIAQTLRVSQQAVSSRLMRARKRLRAALEGKGEEDGR